MLKKLCPICGNQTEIFVEGICLDCYRNEFLKKNKVNTKIKIFQCKYCGKYSISKKYLFYTFEEALNHYIKHNKDYKFENAEVILENEKIKIYRDNILLFAFDLEVEIKPFSCKFCIMKNSGYKQAIIQLRTNKNYKLLDEIGKIVEENSYNDFYSFISRVEKSEKGIDVYIGSKKVAYKILKNFEKKYGISYKISRTLVGVKEGKKVYLDTILIKNGD
ncbi:MAG: NMD3-related protein [Candidatus Aenigmatarchaeota archaeon]